MNIPVSNQKVVAYKKKQMKGLIIKIEVIKRDDSCYPAIKLMKFSKKIE